MNKKITRTGARPYEADIQVSTQSQWQFSDLKENYPAKNLIVSRVCSVSVSLNRLSLLTVHNIPIPELQPTILRIEDAVVNYLEDLIKEEIRAIAEGVVWDYSPVEITLDKHGYR